MGTDFNYSAGFSNLVCLDYLLYTSELTDDMIHVACMINNTMKEGYEC